MTTINLLPWRETYRKQKQKQFFAMLMMGVAFAGGVVFFGIQLMQSKIDFQLTRNSYLESEIQSLQLELNEISKLESTKSSLLSRMEIVQTLQSQRPQLVHVFHELAKRLPDGVFLTSMNQTDDEFIIEGQAESNARVSALMRKLSDSDWFTDPKLEIIEAEKKTGISTFKLGLSQSLPTNKNNEDLKSGS